MSVHRQPNEAVGQLSGVLMVNQRLSLFLIRDLR